MNFTIFAPLPITKFYPRVGRLSVRRHEKHVLEIDSPGILACTSRGVIPHLSRDQSSSSRAVRWVHVPFETFLESNPPVPTLKLQDPKHPIHDFLGYKPEQHIVSMSLRDPSDDKEMPANTKSFVTAFCIQGVRKVTTADWNTYVTACRPDFAVALCDIPFTTPPHSQKRITKSIERSQAWLLEFIRGVGGMSCHNTLVQMAGGIIPAARSAFADSLAEKLHGLEADSIKPLKCLDDGVFGYVFDLLPLHLSLDASLSAPASRAGVQARHTSRPFHADELVVLLKASLDRLSHDKMRIVNTTTSPHEMLRLIRDVGIDFFDTQWAQHAADIGIALDFTFPAMGRGGLQRPNGRKDIGHNLYDPRYKDDFSPIASCFVGKSETAETNHPVCICAACSPISTPIKIVHSRMDGDDERGSKGVQLPYTRAYLHHLLLTHEMSSHTLLSLHNLAVLDMMFQNIRSIIAESGVEHFGTEVARFEEEYDNGMSILNEAEVMCREVDRARGKGRLTREAN